MISVLIPAHNEENIIAQSIESLFNQSLQPHQVIIICDNCTDDTVAIVNQMKRLFSYGNSLFVYETINNKYKKAGALNQVFEQFELQEYVLVMDADVILSPTAIELGIESLENNKKLGAITSRAGIMYMETNNLWEKILYHIQKLEYGSFDSHRIETKGKIKCLQGMFTIFRTKALKEVPIYRKQKLGIVSGIYLDNCLTEDYEISKIMAQKWQIAANLNINAETDVPLTLREIKVQRVRWNVGGIRALMMHGFTKTTYVDILNHFLFFIVFGLQLTVLTLSIFLGKFGIGLSIYILLGICFIDSVYRLKYIKNITSFDLILRLSLIPELLYGLFNIYLLIYSYYLILINREPSWR